VSVQSIAKRPPPRLVVPVELEQRPSVELIASSHEDELRLRSWLSTCLGLACLAGDLGRLLDALDTEEAA
jgi:hypothetical protein